MVKGIGEEMNMKEEERNRGEEMRMKEESKRQLQKNVRRTNYRRQRQIEIGAIISELIRDKWTKAVRLTCVFVS